ncbi:cytochrome C551 [Mesobacillus campisalis]|uniref:Cytochrome C551 n=1 Tax=Mesobacillus campisalis TaxID=1408103 RepID=A0A0M2T0F9_9BACI|nr:cytochrome c [Mesobacillus campisalis]KKK39461.1 cytochrome C551 [Mesobacillus campisalis]
MNKKLLALLFGASLALAACGGGGDEAGGGTGSDSAGAGDPEKLYTQKCSGCHGGDLQGGAGPALANIGSKYSQEEIEGIILNGQGAMPKELLKGEEATAVAEWLAGKK